MRVGVVQRGGPVDGPKLIGVGAVPDAIDDLSGVGVVHLDGVKEGALGLVGQRRGPSIPELPADVEA